MILFLTRGSLPGGTSTMPYRLRLWMLSTAGTTLFIQVKASSSVQVGLCSATTTTRSSLNTVMENTAILSTERRVHIESEVHKHLCTHASACVYMHIHNTMYMYMYMHTHLYIPTCTCTSVHECDKNKSTRHALVMCTCTGRGSKPSPIYKCTLKCTYCTCTM